MDGIEQIAADVKKGKAPYITTPRNLLGLVGASRRGREINSQIRSLLEARGLVTEPDFETAFIDGEIEVKSAPDLVVGGSVPDPVIRVRLLTAANRPPVTVHRDAPVSRAATLMLLNDYSQLPVLASERDVAGMVSWRSIGKARALGKPCEWVRECLEEAHEVQDDTPLLAAIDLITKHEVILVRRRSRVISGLITTTDLGSEFHALAEPFFLLEEIEKQIRRLLDGRFSREALTVAKHAGDGARTISDVSSLTFGEYVRVLQNPSNWESLDIPLDGASVCAQLDRVRDVRNRILHFNPDGTSDEDLELLRDMVGFLQQVTGRPKAE